VSRLLRWHAVEDRRDQKKRRAACMTHSRPASAVAKRSEEECREDQQKEYEARHRGSRRLHLLARRPPSGARVVRIRTEVSLMGGISLPILTRAEQSSHRICR